MTENIVDRKLDLIKQYNELSKKIRELENEYSTMLEFEDRINSQKKEKEEQIFILRRQFREVMEELNKIN